VDVARGSRSGQHRKRRERRRKQTPAHRLALGVLYVALVRRHGEQRAYGVRVVWAEAPIVTVQVPPCPGVLAQLL